MRPDLPRHRASLRARPRRTRGTGARPARTRRALPCVALALIAALALSLAAIAPARRAWADSPAAATVNGNGAGAAGTGGAAGAGTGGAAAGADSADVPVTGVKKVADPDTSRTWRDVLGIDPEGDTWSTARAGRIWVDKSVYADDAALATAGMGDLALDDAENDFMVSLSAIASAASVRRERDVSHDVVFVASANGVLGTMAYAGKPQADYLVSGLNDAIGRVLAQGGTATPRVGVVLYSAEATVAMPLGTYNPDANGAYLAYDAASRTIRVAGTLAQATETGATPRDVALGSGSYLQRAVHLAGTALADAGAAGATGRAPELVIATVETPPMASTQIADPPAWGAGAAGTFLGPVPGSRENGYGSDAIFATLATLRLEKKRVDAAYAAGGQGLAVYTTGIDATDTSAFLLETAAGQASMALPATVGDTTVDIAANVREAAAAYAEAERTGAGTVELSLVGSSTKDLVAEQVPFPVVASAVDEEAPESLSVAHAYYPARSASAVGWALARATDDMLDVTYLSPVNAATQLAGGSRIEATDPLAAGFRIERVRGLRYGSTMLDGALAAKAVVMSLEDPLDHDATHEFDYLVRSVNARFDLGYAAYDLFYQAYQDGQVAVGDDGTFSNRASWYVDAAGKMVADGSVPYTFATSAEVAVAQGASDDPAAAEKIQQARGRGATAIQETYFYIGNLPNPYTGGDVALYDFYVTVECDLETGNQTVRASLPADAVPALKLSVVEAADGSATMALDGAESLAPVRLVYEVAPTAAVRDAVAAAGAGELTQEELAERLGAALVTGQDGLPVVPAGAVTADADGLQAGAIMTGSAARTGSAYTAAVPLTLYTLAPGATAPADGLPAADDLVPLASAPVAGTTYYLVETAYTAKLPADGGTAPATRVDAVRAWRATDDASTWQQAPDGTFELRAGAPLTGDAAAGVRPKAANATATAPYAQLLAGTQNADGTLALSARLGNNGAYRFELAADPDDPGDEPGGEPVGPDEPGKPDEPDEPSDPDTPTDPDDPGSAPDDPTEPGGPSDPDDPNDPGDPDGGGAAEPEKPDGDHGSGGGATDNPDTPADGNEGTDDASGQKNADAGENAPEASIPTLGDVASPLAIAGIALAGGIALVAGLIARRR